MLWPDGEVTSEVEVGSITSLRYQYVVLSASDGRLRQEGTYLAPTTSRDPVMARGPFPPLSARGGHGEAVYAFGHLDARLGP